MKGLVVVSIPKSGTNFLARYLADATGWKFRWGRPSRSIIELSESLPELPNELVYERADHLIMTDKDLPFRNTGQVANVFGGRQIASVRYSEKELEILRASVEKNATDTVIAEHPVESLAKFIRNPDQVKVTLPRDVIEEADDRSYGVVFLYRDLRDIANSFSHFLFEGTRFVKFSSFDAALEVVLECYLPVLANAIRTWQRDFDGLSLTYEQLHQSTKASLNQIAEQFDLPLDRSALIDSMSDYKAFTLRTGKTREYREKLPRTAIDQIESSYADLLPDASANAPS